MLAKLLREYSKVKLINLPKEYDEPKQTKLKEFDIALSKINADNFDELNDITYEDVLKDQLYLFPETNVNFIVRLDKIFKAGQKVSKIAGESAIYDFPAFIPNPVCCNEISGESIKLTIKGIKRDNIELNDDLLKFIALMLDEIKETRGEKKFVIIDNKYGKRELNKYLNKFVIDNFVAIYGLGYNIIMEK